MLIGLAIWMMNQKNNLIVLGTLCLSQPTFDSPGRWKTCLVGAGWAKTQTVVPNREMRGGSENCERFAYSNLRMIYEDWSRIYR